MKLNITDLSWQKMNGLIPAIVQHAKTAAVLMMGYMNQEALQQTIKTNLVTFYSRSKNQLWTKGETSGNKLQLIDIFPDCDNDTLLLTAIPTGPVCHKGSNTCFGNVRAQPLDGPPLLGNSKSTDWEFIQALEQTISERKELRPKDSYTSELFNAGLSRIAQKVGEEGVEVVLAAIEKNDDAFCAEIADLLFHTLVLLKARDLKISDVIKVLKTRR